MNTKTFRLKKYINPDIKLGDTVRIFDGSGLTCKGLENRDFYVIYPYFETTGLSKPLNKIDAIVVSTGIEDNISADHFNDWCYLQDIGIKIGNATFLTCSQFVEKL